jgi:hypothetical protein
MDPEARRGLPLQERALQMIVLKMHGSSYRYIGELYALSPARVRQIVVREFAQMFKFYAQRKEEEECFYEQRTQQ